MYKTSSNPTHSERHLSLGRHAMLRSRAHRQNGVGCCAPRLKAWIALVQYLQSAPVPPHAVNNNACEHFAQYLNQRQGTMVTKAAVAAALVNVVYKVHVPTTRRDLRVLDYVKESHCPLHP